MQLMVKVLQMGRLGSGLGGGVGGRESRLFPCGSRMTSSPVELHVPHTTLPPILTGMTPDSPFIPVSPSWLLS